MALTSFPLQSALLLFATCLGLKTVFYVQRHVFLFETLKKKIPSSLIGGHVSQFCSGIFMLPFISKMSVIRLGLLFKVPHWRLPWYPSG